MIKNKVRKNNKGMHGNFQHSVMGRVFKSCSNIICYFITERLNLEQLPITHLTAVLLYINNRIFARNGQATGSTQSYYTNAVCSIWNYNT